MSTSMKNNTDKKGMSMPAMHKGGAKSKKSSMKSSKKSSKKSAKKSHMAKANPALMASQKLRRHISEKLGVASVKVVAPLMSKLLKKVRENSTELQGNYLKAVDAAINELNVNLDKYKKDL